MSFLDNLENNLKALESREESSANREQEARRREAERREAVAAAPWAERLRTGPYAAALLTQAVRAGHAVRIKVQPAWIDTTLRLEARNRRLELRPGAEGVTAVFLEDGRPVRSKPVDLDGDAAALAQEWLGGLKRDE